ncbi:MAG: domain containing protein, partial [Pedosphaera sp.]|nr:domain containing protein [Pedosphaera sp.]
MPRLVINPGTPQARELPLKPGVNYVGRGFANDLKIEDGSVSTSHCQIMVDGNQVIVKDL